MPWIIVAVIVGVPLWFFIGFRPIFRQWEDDFGPLSIAGLLCGVLACLPLSVIGPVILIVDNDRPSRLAATIGRRIAGKTKDV